MNRNDILHPVTALAALATALVGWATGLAGALGGLLGWVDVGWQLVSSTANLWFPGVAVFASSVAPHVPSIPDDVATQLLLVGAAIYLAVLASRFARKVRNFRTR